MTSPMSAELNELAEGLIQSQIDWWERRGAAMKSSKDVLAFACVINTVSPSSVLTVWMMYWVTLP